MGIALPERAREVLRNKAYAHLVTYNKSGTAQVTMVWVDAEGDEVLVNTEEKRVKVRNALRDPRVVVSVQDPSDPQGSLIIRGTATVTADGASEHLDGLAKRYLGADTYPFHEEGDVRVLMRITPERISGMQGNFQPWG